MEKRCSWFKGLVVFIYFITFCSLSIGIADAWQPNKPVEFVVPAGSGGGADQMARFISPLIAEYKLLSTPWIVINKSGGAGAEGFMYVKGKQKDPEYGDHHPVQSLHHTPGNRRSLQTGRI